MSKLSCSQPNFTARLCVHNCLKSMMIMMMMTCFCETVGQLKSFKVFFESVRFLEILTIANFRHVANIIWDCAEPKFWIYWLTLDSTEAGSGRSSCAEVLLKNFGMFTRKHLCSNLFLIKLQACSYNFKNHSINWSVRKALKIS